MIENFVRHTRIEQAFDRQAARRGDRPAVSTARACCDYNQLRHRAMRVAELLASSSPRGGWPIGILLPNGPAMPEAVLGVWHSRNVVVPISTSYSRSAIERIVATLGIGTIVTSLPDHERFAELAGTVILHDGQDWSSSADRFGPDRAPIKLSADHAAIFLTSGTTGYPKIVALTHQNILTNLTSLKKAVPLDEHDKSYVSVQLCHSYGFTLQMLGTLCAGGQLYIGAGHVISSDFAKEVHTSRCTSLFGVPTAWRLLLDGIGRCGFGEELRHLRALVNGASSMTPEVLAGLRKALPWAEIHLTYGLSEASPLVTSLPPQWADSKPCSIGRAVDGVELVLRREDGQLTTEPGSVGEVFIKGKSVIMGYLDNPSANGASFSQGYLRTGDVAMIDADGCLFFKGRNKDLINRGGEKIYPEDVEAVLQSHPFVLYSAVVPCPHQSLGEVPFAFVVLKEGAASCQPTELRQWCAKRLSAQQVPVGVEIVESLPRTATGKVRKNELAQGLATKRPQPPGPHQTEGAMNHQSNPAGLFIPGAIDMHVHSGQDHVERLMTDEQVVQEALRSGMKGVLLKSHTRCTLGGCTQAQQKLGVQNTAFGSLVLNSWEQIEDIAAIEQAIADGLKVIYMPTVMSANPLTPVHLAGKHIGLLENGKLKPAIVRVIEAAVRGGCTIATGHACPTERLAVLDCCRSLGAHTVLVTHPEYWVTDMPNREQERVAREYPNVLFERTLYSILSEEEARARPGEMTISSEKLGRVVENICRVGAHRTILSSDLGQFWNPPPAKGFELFLEMMAMAKVPVEDIRRMTQANPCRALGLYNEMIQSEAEIALSGAKRSFQTSFDGPPLVGFADANDAAFDHLKQAVGLQHRMPHDVLAGARSVVSVFLPFGRQLVEANANGPSPTPAWCRAYTEGNQCLDVLVTAVAKAIQHCGFKVEVHRGSHHLTNLHEPNVDPSLLTSAWSQRHVAHIAGLGTFGINNLLITAKGAAGRFASLVTDMPLRPLATQTQERCLGKQSGNTQCMECVKRCPAKALSATNFDRMACWNHLVANNPVSRDAGIPIVNVCGKCSSGVPCALIGCDDNDKGNP